jgi:predicted O-methyltransferase YrrM
MSSTHLKITDELAAYIRQASLREPEVLAKLRAETATLPLGSMQITPEQGQFMSLLVRMLDARNTIEVGVFTGYSSICVAEALPSDGRVVACDVSEEYTSIARRFWREAGVEDRIDLRVGPAVATLDQMISSGGHEQFDFAFIDADKANYDAYYERLLILVRAGGVIAIDNVLWHGRVVDATVTDEDTQAIRTLNAKIARDERVWVSMLGIGDGLTLAVKRPAA